MKIIDAYNYIEKLAPFSAQDKYDNSGFLCGNLNDEISGICICLDATLDVIDEAVRKNANLIITHHPVIFEPLYSLMSNSPIYGLIQNKINIICAHTNFDVADNGMNDIMLDLLGFPQKREPIGKNYGKAVYLEKEISPFALAEKVKQVFGCTVLRFVSGNKPVKRVGVCSGAGSGEVENAVNIKCDAFITGDIKWSAFIHAKNCGLTLIDAGHFHTENIMCDFLMKKMQAEFGGKVKIFTSENTVDVCEYLY